jgi:hypothetical protein
MNLDWTMAAVVAGIALNYNWMRNFRLDIRNEIVQQNLRMDEMDEKIFFLATGRKLEDAILERKSKNKE